MDSDQWHDAPVAGKLETIAQPIVVAVMVGCLAISLVQISLAIGIPWISFSAVPMVAIFSGIAAFYGLSGERPDLGWREFSTIGVLTFVFIRFFPYLFVGLSVLLNDISGWARDPFALFDGPSVFETFWVLIFAGLAFTVGLDLRMLRVQTSEVPPPVDSPHYYDWENSPTRHVDHSRALQALVTKFLWCGMAMVVASSISWLGLVRLIDVTRTSDSSGVFLNVLIYFLLGLIAMAYVNGQKLATNWRVDGVKVQGWALPRWVWLGTAVVAGVAVVSMVLPTEYRLSLTGLFTAVATIFAYLIVVLYGILILPLIFLLSLFGVSSGAEQPPAAEPLIMPTTPGSTADWIELLKSIVFWAVILGIAAYVIYSYYQGHREFFARLLAGRAFSPWRRLMGLLRRLLVGILGLAVLSARALSALPALAGRGRNRKQAATHLRWVRLGALSPRHLVQYLYVSIVLHAGRAGVSRRPGQTALEYSEKLNAALPDGAADVDRLTGAYMSARYAPEETPEHEARQAREIWTRLRRLIREQLGSTTRGR